MRQDAAKPGAGAPTITLARTTLRPAFVLAPMEGFTHAELRRILASRGGLGLVCTEFVRVTTAPLGRRMSRDATDRPPETPLSVQVMGREIERMAEAAEALERAGADLIDLNLGCPTPRAARGGVGAAMLLDLELLHRVIAAMRSTVSVPLTAKMRAGFDDASRVLEIASCIESAGADLLTIHPRRRRDAFEGVADWRIIAAVKDAVSIPVVGNGDVWYASDALRMLEETGCDGVMIGRPALRNPWIFRQATELAEGREPFVPTGADWIAHVVEFADALHERHEGREAATLAKLKEMLRFLARALPDGRELLRTVLRLDSLTELLHEVESRVANRAADAFDLDAFGSLRLERSGGSAAPLAPGSGRVSPRRSSVLC